MSSKVAGRRKIPSLPHQGMKNTPYTTNALIIKDMWCYETLNNSQTWISQIDWEYPCPWFISKECDVMLVVIDVNGVKSTKKCALDHS